MRVNGRVYEALSAAFERRRPLDLYHAGLEVRLGEGSFVIEVAPSPDPWAGRRGVVAEGPVESRLLGAARLFRYEVRCWLGGSIPDSPSLVGSVGVSTDADQTFLLMFRTPVARRMEVRKEVCNGDSLA